jgi:hypothetical protein
MGTYGITDSQLLNGDRSIMRPTSSRSRSDKFRSFLLQFSISTKSAALREGYELNILFDTLKSYHALFKLNETPDYEQ